jgi:hypothetical protein
MLLKACHALYKYILMRNFLLIFIPLFCPVEWKDYDADFPWGNTIFFNMRGMIHNYNNRVCRSIKKK